MDVQLHHDYASYDVSFLFRNVPITLAFTRYPPHRFPNVVPYGTSVPFWALIDVTVRCHLFPLT